MKKKNWLHNYAKDGKNMPPSNLWETDKTAWMDSVMNANANKDWVQQMYNPKAKTLDIDGVPRQQFLEYGEGDGRQWIYPTINRVNGIPTYFGNNAGYYAAQKQLAIPVETPEQADYFIQNSDRLSNSFSEDIAQQRFRDSYKKNGGMIKRADGSYSQRGLWDNIRANAGSGKKPTKEMLKQEKKIRAKEKAKDGIKVAPVPYQDMDPAMLQQYRLMEELSTAAGRARVSKEKVAKETAKKDKETKQYMMDKAAQQRAASDPSMFTPSFWKEDQMTGRTPEQRLYDMGTDLQTRVFQTGNKTYDSYLNAPGYMSHMAGNLAKAPLKAKQENSVMHYVSAIAEPLVLGAAEAVVAPYLKKMLSKKPVVYGESNVVPHDPYSSISMRPGGNGKFPMAVIKKTKGNTPMPFETEIDPSTVPDFNVGIELDSRGYPIDSKDPSKNILQREIRQLFSNINPENLNTSSGLDWMKQWYSDPEFIKRYSSTGKYHSTAMQEHITDQLNEYVPKNYTDLLKDEGLKTYIDKSLSTGGLSYGAPNQIYTNRAMYFPFNKKGLESVRAHELTHLIEANGVHLGPADEAALQKPFDLKKLSEKPNSLKKAFGNNPHYYMDPTEIHARMNQARFELGLSPKDKFTEEMFDKISKEKDWYGMGKYIKDKKGFTSLMNNFWSVAPYAVPATIAMSQKDNKKNGGKITNNWLQNY
jgi:hypothetical protein